MSSCYETGWNLIVTFYLYTDEYENIVMYYETKEKMSDFECETLIYDDDLIKCSVELGKIKDWQARGLK